jgi:beta-phosphoglucomutase
MSKIRFNVKSVIFDMDGVITNTMPDHYRSWKATLQEEGLHVTYEDIYKREGQPGISSVRELFEEYQMVLDGKKASRILRKKENFFKKIVKARFITGARNFLRHLHGNGMCLALVTGTSRHELHQILPKALQDLFSVIVTGGDVKHGKPHPEPYLKSLRDLRIKPSEAVVIENAPFGIRSAKQAGLKCLALETSLPKKYLLEADAVFSSIKELQSKVLFLN